MPVQSPREQPARPAGVAAAPPASPQRHLLHTPRVRRRRWCVQKSSRGKNGLSVHAESQEVQQPPAPLCSDSLGDTGRERRGGGGTTGEESVTKLLPGSAICPSLFHGQWAQLNVCKSTRRREHSHHPSVGEDRKRSPSTLAQPGAKGKGVKSINRSLESSSANQTLNFKTGCVSAPTPGGSFPAPAAAKVEHFKGFRHLIIYGLNQVFCCKAEICLVVLQNIRNV